jgi:hypothetical protein
LGVLDKTQEVVLSMGGMFLHNWFSCFLRRSHLRIAFDDPGTDGKMGQACDPAVAELFHEMAALFFDGFEADAQFRGGLFVEFAAGDELQHCINSGLGLLFVHVRFPGFTRFLLVERRFQHNLDAGNGFLHGISDGGQGL